MKKLLVLMLVVLTIAFLALTNPTTEEYAQWYTDQSFPDKSGTMDDLIAQFNLYMANSATRKDYLVCSVYDYCDHKTYHKTLGIALMFLPLDDAVAQAEDLRADYAAWLKEINSQH